jgi:hypothetical protein
MTATAVRPRPFLALRRDGETDASLGVRIALTSPILGYFVLVAGMLAFHVAGEAGLALFFIYWLYIGICQWVYLVPLLAFAFATRRNQLALGVIKGGAIIGAANLVAWAIGLRLGVW